MLYIQSPNPSFLLRRLSASIPLIKARLFRIIGDGKFVDIWKDKWVPTPSSFCIQPPIHHLPGSSKVEVLIDSEIGAWYRNLIYQLFTPEEARQILSIPLSHLGAADKLIWSSTTDGRFTVKLAYHLELERTKGLEGEQSNQDQEEPYWKALWDLNIQEQSNNFFWRACNELLLTKENLLKKHIIDTSLCPVCEREQESLIHAIWDCPAAADV